MLRAAAGGRNTVLGLPAVQIHRLPFVAEQIHRRRAVQLQGVPGNPGIRWQNPAEMKTQTDLIRLQRRQTGLQPADIHKPESLRKDQVLLDNAVPGIGILRIRQNRLIRRKTHRLQQRRRQVVDVLAHHQLHTAEVMVQPQVQGFSGVVIPTQIEPQAVQPQTIQRLVRMQGQVDGDGRHFP